MSEKTKDQQVQRATFQEPVGHLGNFKPNRELAARIAAEIARDFKPEVWKTSTGESAGTSPVTDDLKVASTT